MTLQSIVTKGQTIGKGPRPGRYNKVPARMSQTPKQNAMFFVNQVTSNLEPGEDGIWFSRNSSDVSYPSSGNEDCFEIEESSFWFQHRNRCLVACVKAFPPSGPIVDIGGGNGFVSQGLQASGWETVVVEPGRAGAFHARRRGLEQVICSTLEDAGFREHSLPAVGVFDVIEHIQEDRQFLSKLRRLLVQAGRIYITVPAYSWLWSSDDAFAGHYRRYTLASLRSALDGSGFDVEFASYIFGLLPLPVLLVRSIPSKLGLRSKELPNSARQHRLSAPIRTLADLAFHWELRAIEQRRSIPFGGSCLVVARAK